MRKILWISDFGGSGYTTASIETINGLMKYNNDFEIYLYAVNNYYDYAYHNDKLKKVMFNYDKIKLIVPEKNPIINKLNPTDKIIKDIIINEIMGFNKLIDVLKTVEPDICVILNDNSMLMKFYKLIKKSKIDTKIIAYMPIDCHTFGEGEFDFLEQFDKIFTMTNFGKNEIMKTNFPKEIIVMNHPISTDFFKPLDKSESRKRLYLLQNKENIDNAFLILNFNDNTPSRKHVEITVEAFALFMQKNPDANAYLIIKPKRQSIINEKETDYNIYLSIYPKLMDRIIYINKHLNYEEINDLYNSVNVGVNTCYGEGWGLIACEMALCNIPQILPDNTCHKELFKESCYLVETENFTFNKKEEERLKEPPTTILWSQGILDHVESGIIEENVFEDNHLPINFKIFVSKRVVNNGLLIGEMKITDNFSVNTGTNNLEDIKYFIRKVNPIAFQIIIETDIFNKYLYEQVKNFDWEELRNIYNITQVKKESVINSYNVNLIRQKLPKVEMVSKGIDFYYHNPQQAIEDGMKCRKEMLYYNKERIGKEINDIFIDLTKNMKKKEKMNMEDID